MHGKPLPLALTFALAMLCVSGVDAQSIVDFREAIRNVEPSLMTVVVDRVDQVQQAPAAGEAAGPDRPRGRRIEFFGLNGQPLNPFRGGGQRFFADGSPQEIQSAAFAVDDASIVAFVGSEAETVRVQTPNDESVEGKVVARDYVTGLAVIEADVGQESGLVVSAAQTEPGMPVVAAWVENHNLRTDFGMVSSRPVATGSGIGLTSMIDFGSTQQMVGAPVVDPTGIVVGVLVPSKHGGLVCARSVDVLRLIEIAKNDSPKDLKRGLIGIQFAGGGPLVQKVSPGSGAEEAGISAGDLIRTVGQLEIRGAEDVVAAVASARAGDALEITVLRGDQTLTVSVVLQEHPDQRINQAIAQFGSAPMQQAFELKDGKLVPMEIDPDGIPFPGGRGLFPTEDLLNELQPNWQLPRNRGGVDGFQIERSDVEKTLKELQRQMEQLNEKLDKM